MQLAEGQSADVKHLGALLPLSANSDNWRRGSNFPRKTPLFANLAPHLADRVKSPRESETVRPPADGTYSSFFAGGGAGAPGAGAIFSIFFWAGAGAGAGRTTGPAGRGATVGGGGVILDMLVIMKMNQPK